MLDIGCGNGQTTHDAARTAGEGSALGVDLSTRMVEHARRLASDAGIANATFAQADAQIHPFTSASFDAAISRTGTMFFGDPKTAFLNIARALRPGGRLVMLVWQGPGPNEWIRELSTALAAGREMAPPPIGAPGPFAQADPDSARDVLTSVGFSDVRVEGSQAPMWFGADPQDAQRFVLGLMGWMLHGLDDAGRNGALDQLQVILTDHHDASGVSFGSATWTISATRP